MTTINDVSVEDDCIKVTENTTGPIVDLDAGTGANPDAGKDICALTDKNVNGFGEDTDKPTSYTLSLGDALTSDIDSSQGDKLEVGAVMGADSDGDGSYLIRVSGDGDWTKTDKLFFEGDVASGESFTASEAAFGTSFGSETYVHILSSDGSTVLQTINFHTSCSAPLVIGDQYGSVSLEGASLVGKDSGTVYEVGGTSAPGDEGVTYSIQDGPGSDLFEVNADGEVSFKEAPDFEDPQGILDADGNPTNNYEVVVLATLEDGSVIEKPVEICVEDDCIKVTENTTGPIVDLDAGTGANPDAGKDICALTDKNVNGFGEDTDKPTSYTLSLGDALTSDIDSSQGDKLEVGAVMGADSDGDGSYLIRVSGDGDWTKTDKLFFEGDVASGESFTASEAAFGTSFGSETYVHILSSDGSTVLQTINFHTSCSAPLVIGDQYGSVSLEGASLVGKDSGTVYEVGGTSAPGDEGVTYSIQDGPGSDLFEVNADGEVSFKEAPDFEDPQGILDADGNPTNNYEVVVLATLEDGSVIEKPVEICVEDDCIKVTENTTGPIVDLDAGTGANPDAGKDICALTDKNVNGFGEDTDKPTSYTLSLGDALTSDIDSSQGDKLEVGAVMGADSDGDGSYLIRVSGDGDWTKTDKLFFEGDVASGESFTASEAAFGTSFGSETYVHILSSDGSTVLQTINFHTSCSAPLVIGDQYGSVSLEGASLVGKDSGTVYEVGGTSAPGDEGVTYSIQDGPGSDLFEVNADGEVSFKEAPDFEDPQGILDADGNPTNNYEVVVLATLEDGSVIEKPVEICVEDDCIKVTENTTGPIVDLDAGTGANPDAGKDICALTDKNVNGFGEDTDKPTSYTLSLGDALTSDIDSSQGDKLEVGAVMGADSDGDGSYLIRVSGDGDWTKTDKLFFEGDVASGESFTASEAAFGTSFGSETFVHILSSDGSTVLQTINFHTSCSAPLVIGDQYGSVSLEGASLVGKDSGTVYEVGGTSAPGDEGVTYSIQDGPGSDLFEVNADGEVSFVTPPDFEDPQGILDADGNPTNNYEVVVLATLEDGSVIEKPVEICVEDFTSDKVCADFEPAAGFGGVDLGGLTDYLFLFADGSQDANWQGASKGFVGDVAVDGIQADERTSGDVPYSGVIRTNDAGLGSWQDIVDNNPGTASVETGQVALIDSLEADLDSAFTQIDSLSASAGFESIDSSALNGLDTRDGVAQTYVINVTSGFSISDTIDITGDADDNFILRWDEDADATNGYQGTVKFQSGGGINPLGDLDASNFVNVAGNINASGGGSTPSGLVDEVSALGTEVGSDVSGGGYFTGYWLTTGDPSNGDTESLSNAIFVGGWYTTSDKFSLTSGTSGVHVEPSGATTAALGDFVFFDSDGDGVQDADEAGVADVLVTLKGAGVDGVFGTADDTTRITETNSEGRYHFDGLTPGESYKATFSDLPEGFVFTTPNAGDDTLDSDANPSNGMTDAIVLAPGEVNCDVDAGLVQTAALGDFVFEDLDADGIQDAGEAGIGGVGVTLTGGGADGVIGTPDDTTATTTTAADGSYAFTGLNPGEEYQVSFDTPAGFVPSLADQGGDDTADSDGLTTGIVTLASGENDPTLDQGFYELASLGDRVFEDTNGDGIQDGGEPGVPNVTVELLDGAGQPVLVGGNPVTATTDANGDYLFEDLVPGDYQVRFTPPAGFGFTTPNQGGDDALDSDADQTSGTTQTVTLVSGENNLTLDAGLVQTASLGDFVFEDLDADGIQDAGEAGIAGVTVTLTGGGDDGLISTAGDNDTFTTTTDGTGLYQFTGLNPGEEYQVSFEQPSGFDSVSPADQGGDDTADSDGLTAPIVTLASGETNPTIDQGFYNTAGLGDFVFEDLDGNGIQDAGEPGVDGVTVELKDGSGNTVATTTTNASGGYSFTGLTPGTYAVAFTAPEGFAFTAANAGPNDAIDSDADQLTGFTQQVTLTSGEFNDTLDAGLVAENADPEATPENGKGCADEPIEVDLSDNVSDPDGDPVTITAINGVTIADGQTKQVDLDGVGGRDPVNVLLSGDTFIFDGEDAYADLDIGDEETAQFTYTVSDGNGGEATSTIDVTFCGVAETVAEFGDSLPSSGTLQVLIETFLNDPNNDPNLPETPEEEYWTIKLTDTGDIRFDGMVFDEGYCLEINKSVDGLAGTGQTDIDLAPNESVSISLLNDEFDFGSNTAFDPGDNMRLTDEEVANAINWILNQDFNGSGYDGEGFVMNAYSNGDPHSARVTDGEVQGAIWKLADNNSTITQGLGSQSDITKIVDLALQNTDFEVGVNDKIGIVLDPLDNKQAFVFAVDFEAYDCIC